MLALEGEHPGRRRSLGAVMRIHERRRAGELSGQASQFPPSGREPHAVDQAMRGSGAHAGPDAGSKPGIALEDENGRHAGL